MESFFTFIFFTIVTIYLLGFIGRALLRYWLRRKQEQFTRQFGDGNDASRSRRKEGEVTIEHTQRSGKKVRGNVGDYVDFEEIEEQSE